MRVDPDSDMTWWWLYAVPLCVTKINLYFYLTKYRDSMGWWWQVMSKLWSDHVSWPFLTYFSLYSRRRNIGLETRKRKKPVVSSQVLIWWKRPASPEFWLFLHSWCHRDRLLPLALWSQLQLASFWRWSWGGGGDPSDLIQFIAVWKYQDERRLLAWGAFLHAILSSSSRQVLALGNVKIETLGWGSGSSCLSLPPPCLSSCPPWIIILQNYLLVDIKVT